MKKKISHNIWLAISAIGYGIGALASLSEVIFISFNKIPKAPILIALIAATLGVAAKIIYDVLDERAERKHLEETSYNNMFEICNEVREIEQKNRFLYTYGIIFLAAGVAAAIGELVLTILFGVSAIVLVLAATSLGLLVVATVLRIIYDKNKCKLLEEARVKFSNFNIKSK